MLPLWQRIDLAGKDGRWLPIVRTSWTSVGRDRIMNPNAMAVEFALFHHDALLCRSTIRIEEQQKSEEFEYTDPSDATGSGSSRGHLVIRHEYGLPAASLQLWLVRYDAPESAGEIILEAALAMGVHDSEDWESVALGEDYTFAFACRQEVKPAQQ